MFKPTDFQVSTDRAVSEKVKCEELIAKCWLRHASRAAACPKLPVAAWVRLAISASKHAFLGFEPEDAYRIIALSLTL